MFRCSFRPEVVRDAISGANVGLVAVDVPVKNGDYIAQTFHEICSSEAAGCGIFDRLLNFDNCPPEVVSDVISGILDHDVSVDVFANFCDSRLKPSEASCSALVRSSIVFNIRCCCRPTGVKVRVIFGDSRSNRSRDVQLPHFVRTTTTTTTTTQPDGTSIRQHAAMQRFP